jgi:hypothetical protein
MQPRTRAGLLLATIAVAFAAPAGATIVTTVAA